MEYGAIDLHARYSQIRIIDEEGRVQVDRRIPTSVQSLRGVFAGRPRMRLLLETGPTASGWRKRSRRAATT